MSLGGRAAGLDPIRLRAPTRSRGRHGADVSTHATSLWTSTGTAGLCHRDRMTDVRPRVPMLRPGSAGHPPRRPHPPGRARARPAAAAERLPRRPGRTSPRSPPTPTWSARWPRAGWSSTAPRWWRRCRARTRRTLVAQGAVTAAFAQHGPAAADRLAARRRATVSLERRGAAMATWASDGGRPPRPGGDRVRRRRRPGRHRGASCSATASRTGTRSTRRCAPAARTWC